MAGKDRIGALYYEVILDPKGFAKGAASVKREEDMLVRAVKSTTTALDSINAEIKGVIDASLKAEGEKRDLLRRYAQQLLADKKAMIQEEQDAKDAAAERDRQRLEEQQARDAKATEKRLRDAVKHGEQVRSELAKIRDAELAEFAEKRKRRQSERNWFKWKLEALQRHSKAYDRASSSQSKWLGKFRSLGGMFKSLGGQFGKINGGLSKLAGNLAQAGGMSTQIQGLVRAMAAFGPQVLIATVLVTGLVAVLWKAASIADAWIQKEKRLAAVMQGRSALAKELEKDLRNLANTTAFSADQLMDMAIALKTAGVATRDVRGIAETIGALGGGDAEKMKFIQKAYTDVLTKGKLMGQEALQLANQGVPIYRALAGSMGISATEAQKLAQSGKISAEEFKKAMEYQAEAVGGTAAMEAGVWSIAGQWGQAKKAIWDLMLTIGEEIQPALVWIMAGVKWLAIGFSTVVKVVMKLGMYLLAPWTALRDAYYWLTGQQDLATEKAAEYADEMARAKAEAEATAEAQQKTADALLEKEKDATRDPEEIKRRDHRRELNRMIEEGEITKEQAKRIVRERGWQERKAEMARAEEERLKRIAEQDEAREERKRKKAEEARKKAEEDAKKLEELRADAYEQAEAQRQADVKLAEDQHQQELDRINSELDKKISDREAADSSSGAAFEAGSAEEHQFLREMEMQARRDKMIEQWEAKADTERTTANAHLASMRISINSMANNEKTRIAAADELSDFGYP